MSESKISKLSPEDIARASQFVPDYKSAMSRKERVSETSLILRCLLYIGIAIIPWLFTAAVFFFVDERIETNAQILELQTQSQADTLAGIEAQIESVKAALESQLTPSLRVEETAKLANLQAKLSAEKTAEINRIHAAQRGEYILFAAGIFSNAVFLMMWIYQVRIVRRQWQNLFPTSDLIGRFRYPMTISISLATVTFLTFLLGFEQLLYLPSILDLERATYGHLVVALAAAQVTALTFVTAFGVSAIRRNYPDAAVVARHVKTLKERSKYDYEVQDFQNVTLIGLGETLTPKKDDKPKPAISPNMVAKPEEISTKPAQMPLPPYLDNGLPAQTCSALIVLLSRVLGFSYIIFVIYLGIVISFLSIDLGAEDTITTALADLSEGWLIAIGTGFTLVLLLIYVVPISGLAPFVPDQKPSPKIQIKGSKDGLILLDAPKEKAEKSKLQERVDELWHERECELGADQKKFTAIIGSAHKGAGFHDLVGGSLLKLGGKFLGLISPTIAAGALSFLV